MYSELSSKNNGDLPEVGRDSLSPNLRGKIRPSSKIKTFQPDVESPRVLFFLSLNLILEKNKILSDLYIFCPYSECVCSSSTSENALSVLFSKLYFSVFSFLPLQDPHCQWPSWLTYLPLSTTSSLVSPKIQMKSSFKSYLSYLFCFHGFVLHIFCFHGFVLLCPLKRHLSNIWMIQII